MAWDVGGWLAAGRRGRSRREADTKGHTGAFHLCEKSMAVHTERRSVRPGGGGGNRGDKECSRTRQKWKMGKWSVVKATDLYTLTG